MRKSSRGKIKISDKTYVLFNEKTGKLEIVFTDDQKTFVENVYGDKLLQLKHMLSVAGLPPILVRVQLAIKAMISNRLLWIPNEEQSKKYPHESSRLRALEKDLINSFNRLSIYNTKKQRDHIRAIKDVEDPN